MKSLIWPARLLIYGGFAVLVFGVIKPNLDGFNPAQWLLLSLLAAVIIAGELLLSAKLSGRGLEETVVGRVASIDNVLSQTGPRHQHQLGTGEEEVVDVEILERGQASPELRP